MFVEFYGCPIFLSRVLVTYNNNPSLVRNTGSLTGIAGKIHVIFVSPTAPGKRSRKHHFGSGYDVENVPQNKEGDAKPVFSIPFGWRDGGKEDNTILNTYSWGLSHGEEIMIIRLKGKLKAEWSCGHILICVQKSAYTLTHPTPPIPLAWRWQDSAFSKGKYLGWALWPPWAPLWKGRAWTLSHTMGLQREVKAGPSREVISLFVVIGWNNCVIQGCRAGHPSLRADQRHSQSSGTGPEPVRTKPVPHPAKRLDHEFTSHRHEDEMATPSRQGWPQKPEAQGKG